MDGVGCYTLGAETVVQGAGVDEGGEFGVAVSFPDCTALSERARSLQGLVVGGNGLLEGNGPTMLTLGR